MNASGSRPVRGLSYFLAASSNIALDWESVDDEQMARVLELIQQQFGKSRRLPQTFEELMAVFNAQSFLKNISGPNAELLHRSLPALPVKVAGLFLYRDHPMAVIMNPREPDAVGIMCTDDNWMGVNADELKELCEGGAAEIEDSKDNTVTVAAAPSTPLTATPRVTRSASIRARRTQTPTPSSKSSAPKDAAPVLERQGSSSGVKRKRAESTTPQPRRVRKDTITSRFHREVVEPLQQLRRREDPVVFFSGRGFKMEPLKSLLPPPPVRERISHFIQNMRK